MAVCAPSTAPRTDRGEPAQKRAALDAADLAACGFSAKNDLLAQLLEQAEHVTPPGIPATFPNPETLISDDCIRPPTLA